MEIESSEWLKKENKQKKDTWFAMFLIAIVLSIGIAIGGGVMYFKSTQKTEIQKSPQVERPSSFNR